MKLLGVFLASLLLQSTLSAKIKDIKSKLHNTDQAKAHHQIADPFLYNPQKIQKAQSSKLVKETNYGGNAPATSNHQQQHVQQYANHPKDGAAPRKISPRIGHQKSDYTSLPLRHHQELTPVKAHQNVPISKPAHEPVPVQHNNQVYNQQDQGYLGLDDQNQYQSPQSPQKDAIQSRHDIYEPDYDFHDHGHHQSPSAHHHNGNARQPQQYQPNRYQTANRFNNNDNFRGYDDNPRPKVKTFFRDPFGSSNFGSINRPSASESHSNPRSRGSGAGHQSSGGYEKPKKGCKFVEKEVKDLPRDGSKKKDGFTSNRYMMVKECFYDDDRSFGNNKKPTHSSGNHENKGSESQDHRSPYEYSFNDDDFFKDYFSNDGNDGFHQAFSEDHFLVRPFRD